MTQQAQRVTFESQGEKLVGRLFIPAGGKRSPGVVVTGSWMTVKEQMPATYSAKLCEAGFVALTFDFRGYGESAGTPREVESARAKAEDIAAAAKWLSAQPSVESGRVGVLPICASAGYTALAARKGAAFKSVAMVAPWLHDRPIVESFYGGAEGVARRMEQAATARSRFESTGTVDYVKGASNSDATAAMYWEGNALDYYLNPKRGAVPEWNNRFALMAWAEWLQFDPIALAHEVEVPVRLVTGEQTATPGGAKQFSARLRAPHDVVSLPGSQFDFYDDPKTVSAASAAAVDHFRSTL